MTPDRWVVLVYMYDHWGVTWFGNDESEARRVVSEAEKKVKTVLVDTK